MNVVGIERVFGDDLFGLAFLGEDEAHRFEPGHDKVIDHGGSGFDDFLRRDQAAHAGGQFEILDVEQAFITFLFQRQIIGPVENARHGQALAQGGDPLGLQAGLHQAHFFERDAVTLENFPDIMMGLIADAADADGLAAQLFDAA